MSDLIADVRDLIREGYGYEDIAIQLDLEADAIRRMVNRWRETGALKSILKNGKEIDRNREATLHRPNRNAQMKGI